MSAGVPEPPRAPLYLFLAVVDPRHAVRWSYRVRRCRSDPYATRILGDARTTPLGQVWRGPTIERLRRDLNRGGSSFCGDCPLKLPLAADDTPRARSTSVGCRLGCTSSALPRATSRVSSLLRSGNRHHPIPRGGDTRLRSVPPGRRRGGTIDFFNYGEAFLHKRAVEMCECIKTRFPQVYLYTSTNGLAFTEECARRPGSLRLKIRPRQ